MSEKKNFQSKSFRYRKELQGSLVGVFVIGLILFLASCAANPVTGQPQLMLLSEGEEIQLGRQTDGQIVEDYGTYPDQKLILNSDIRIKRETVLPKKVPRARIRNFQLTAVSCIWRRPVPW